MMEPLVSVCGQIGVVPSGRPRQAGRLPGPDRRFSADQLGRAATLPALTRRGQVLLNALQLSPDSNQYLQDSK